MSYCRWSSNNFKSDVYCYACVDGTWTTHVAGVRIENVDDLPPDRLADFLAHKITAEEYAACERARHKIIMQATHDGATFRDAGPAEMRWTLLRLRGLGYHVPDHAITALEEEIAERTAAVDADK